MNCLKCGAKMQVSHETRKDTTSGLPYVVFLRIEVRRCTKCGEEEIVIPKVTEYHQKLANMLVRKTGRLTPAEIKYLRKHLGWSGQDFARHMNVTGETVSRWEHGHENMSATAERLLRLACAHYTPVENYNLADMDAAGKGRQAPLRIVVSLARRGWKMTPAGS